MSHQEPRTRPDHNTRGKHAEPESALLKLLGTLSDDSVEHLELRDEIRRLIELLERIETLAERDLAKLQASAPSASPSHDEPHAEEVPGKDTAGKAELDIGGNVVAFDPAEFVHPPEAASPVAFPESEPAVEQQPDPEPPDYSRLVHDYEPRSEQIDDHLERWWVHFNGDVSLERLRRLRKEISESPFTLEARFDEITDGLIVFRLVTEGHLSMKQVEWIVEQVMNSVGLNRDAAIVSRK